jgi:outer membrane protein W
MKKIVIIALIAIFSAGSFSYAQNGNLFLQQSQMSFSYQMGFPTGDLKTFIDQNDYLGWDFELKAMVTHNLALGGHIGYQGFYKKFPRDTYEFPQGAITTTIFKYYYTIPMQAVATWFFMPEGMVQPYLGMNIGVNYNERRGEIGIYLLEDNSWNFSLAPEAGVIVPFGKYSMWGTNIRAKYNYNVYSRNDNLGQDFNQLAYWNMMFGLTYTW